MLVEEILRIPALPKDPGGIVIDPITKVEFPVIVIMVVVVEEPGKELLKRHADD